MKNAIPILALFSISILCFAEDEPGSERPKSPVAVAALNKHELIVARAKVDCQRAIAGADKQLVADLDDAMKLAMEAQNVEEIKRIDVARKEVVSGTKAGRAASGLVGTWHCHSPAGESTYRLTPTEVFHTGTNERGVPTYRGDKVFIRWPSGFLEVWVLGAEHALIEAWEPKRAAHAPAVFPTNYGVAERIADEKPR